MGNLLSGGFNFQRGTGQLNSQRGLDSGGLLFFMQICYFCGNIVMNYSYHYICLNIFDIAESLTQRDYGPI